HVNFLIYFYSGAKHGHDRVCYSIDISVDVPIDLGQQHVDYLVHVYFDSRIKHGHDRVCYSIYHSIDVPLDLR
ncbi:hypothetical protein JX266_014551, partial [Neoarthrinium moseri]